MGTEVLASTAKKFGVPTKSNPLISIVDDDESVREAIAGLVTWLGFRVQTFESAVEFLQSPGLADTSCIITDVQMPHMTGIELHKRLTELGYAIPTIMITAYPNDAVRERVLADGTLCYLSKPFDNEALIDCIRLALKPPAR
ncbi:MAG: response regulator transcription factor [Candidatus Acidiferrales bacterium]